MTANLLWDMQAKHWSVWLTEKQFRGNQDSVISKSRDQNGAFVAFGYLVLSTPVV